MVDHSKYWQLMRLDSTGRRRTQEIIAAKTFFEEQFASLLQRSDLSDVAIQRQLMQLRQAEDTRTAAERCLRCYISQQVVLVCLQLEVQFGRAHGFSCNDLLSYVLDDGEWADRSPTRSSNLSSSQPLTAGSGYQAFYQTVLQGFDPDRASLNTWVTQLVRRHPELNHFLLQQGVYLISDWAILNDTTPTQLQRIYLEFHSLTLGETQRAMGILQAYHRVYRQDRLNQRQTVKNRQCLPPNPEQLQRMADQLKSEAVHLHPERILSQLQGMARLLRQYRIYVKGGKVEVASLDRPEIAAVVGEQPAAEPDATQAAKSQFLSFYRQQLLTCLDETLAQVIQERVTYLQRKRPPTDRIFLTGLHLFHCQGWPMGEIAAELGLQAQYQVSRLLKLKELRADIRQRALRLLLDWVLTQAQKYTDPTQLQDWELQNWEQQVEALLAEQIDTVIQQAEAEAVVAKHSPLTSSFAQRLCRHLDTRLHT